jgi:RNA polymerase sigma-70 factor (ECF subfamily)
VTGPPTTSADSEVVEIYRATIRSLYAYVSRRVGGDRSLAEDLVQETWMRAIAAWRMRGLPDEPMAWLTLVARNLMVSHFRRHRPASFDSAAVDLEGPAWTPDSPDKTALVSCGIARLPSRHRELLEAFYFDGRSVRQIAVERATSERAIEGRLRRARGLLRAQIDSLTTATNRPGTTGTK